MHQPSISPNVSSYFQYQVYPFRRPPEMDGDSAVHPVVVVGAGPVGMLLAIFLQQQGVPTVLLEAEAQVSGGSRALAFTRRSMEIFEQAGVAHEIVRDALLWREGRSYFRNREVHHLDIPFGEHDKFWPMTNLPQCQVEQVLLDRALALGVDVRLQTLVTGLDESGSEVVLHCDTPEGAYRLTTQWVVACDGARSPMRRFKGLRFTGQSFEGRFVIADIRMTLDAPAGRRCYFDPSWLPGEAALMHKAPFDVWRLDYRVPDDVSDELAMDRDRIRGQVQAHLAEIGVDLPWEFEWVTLYKPNALTLESYRHGRVLFAGDAAHLLPVFGVRGLNTGAQDTINLAWKLAAVVQGRSGEALLDTYSDERVADARQICIEAGRSTRMMAPPTSGHALLRKAVLSLALDHDFVRDLLHWRTSRPIDYEDSALTQPYHHASAFSGGPPPGAPARNVRLRGDAPSQDPPPDGEPIQLPAQGNHLLDHCDDSFHLLVIDGEAALIDRLMAERDAWRDHGLYLRVVVVGNATARACGADVCIDDPEGRVRAVWGAPPEGAVYLLRPDQHVAGRWRASAMPALDEPLSRVLCLNRPES